MYKDRHAGVPSWGAWPVTECLACGGGGGPAQHTRGSAQRTMDRKTVKPIRRTRISQVVACCQYLSKRQCTIIVGVRGLW